MSSDSSSTSNSNTIEEETTTVTPPPSSDRVVKEVPHPISTRLEHDVLFKADGTVDIAALQKHLYGEGKLHQEDIEEIINRCNEILAQEPTLLPVEAPITGILLFLKIIFLCALL